MTLPLLADPTNYGNKPGDGPLRVGGETASGLPLRNADLPSTLSPAVSKQQAALALVRDLWGGAETLRARGPVYLPQAPGEDPKNYSTRLTRSVFFNIFKATVEGLTGFIFAKDPVLGPDVPPQIVEHCENIDNAGTHIDVFAHDILQDALDTGHAAILVDYPNTGGLALTLADEQPLRPYWVPIKKDDIMSWRTVVEDGQTILTQLVLRESRYVADGEFGEMEQVRYRVLYRDGGVVGYRLLEILKDKSVVEVEAGLYGNQIEIPVAEIPTSGRRGLFESDPPLLDLAYLNVAHYQQWSDYATSIHKTCVPIFVTTGDEGEGAIIIGPNAGLRLPNPAARAQYVSHDGASLAACKASLDDLISHMASLGLSMLAAEKRVAETAKAKQIDKATTDSKLSVTSRGAQDGFERALAIHARYMKLYSDENGGGSIQLNRDFDAITLDSAEMTAYIAGVAQAGLPVRLLLQAWQAGGRIGPDEDLEELEAEVMANQAGIADANTDAIALGLPQEPGTSLVRTNPPPLPPQRQTPTGNTIGIADDLPIASPGIDELTANINAMKALIEELLQSQPFPPPPLAASVQEGEVMRRELAIVTAQEEAARLAEKLAAAERGFRADQAEKNRKHEMALKERDIAAPTVQIAEASRVTAEGMVGVAQHTAEIMGEKMGEVLQKSQDESDARTAKILTSAMKQQTEIVRSAMDGLRDAPSPMITVPAPIVNVPEVRIPAPVVNVTVEPPRPTKKRVTVKRNADGTLTGTVEEVED